MYYLKRQEGDSVQISLRYLKAGRLLPLEIAQRKNHCSLLQENHQHTNLILQSVHLTNRRTRRIHKRLNLILQERQRPSQRRSQSLAPQEIRHERQSELIEEANKLGWVQEIRRVIYATSDVTEVHASEAIDRAGIAADGDRFRYYRCNFHEIQSEVGRVVVIFCTKRTAVPVVWDALVAWCIGERAVVCFGDSEEGFEGFFVEDAVGVFSGVVGHQGRCAYNQLTVRSLGCDGHLRMKVCAALATAMPENGA